MESHSEKHAKKLVAMMKNESSLTLARFVAFLAVKGHVVGALAEEFAALKPLPPAAQAASKKRTPRAPRNAKKQEPVSEACDILHKDAFVC